MQNRAFALRVSTGIATISLLASPLTGCSGSSSALPAGPALTAPATATQPAAGKPKLLFVSDNENNRISVFDTATRTQNPPPIRTITTGIAGPNGITTDRPGNLYVANYVSNSVTVYAPDAGTPKTTITNGLNGPFDVKVDGFGNVYVANNPLSGAAPFIQLYPKGASSPSYTWTAPASGMVISGLALLNPLQKGETSIYALEYTLNPSDFAIGGALTCYPGAPTCTQLAGYSFGQTGGIAVAQSPSSKPFQFLAVDQYIPGIDILTLGQPSSQMVTGGTPEFITLNSTGSQLYVADRFYGRVVEYSFPAGKQLNTFTPGGGQIYGVATSPSEAYH
jgi:hypothetical protein